MFNQSKWGSAGGAGSRKTPWRGSPLGAVSGFLHGLFGHTRVCSSSREGAVGLGPGRPELPTGVRGRPQSGPQKHPGPGLSHRGSLCPDPPPMCLGGGRALLLLGQAHWLGSWGFSAGPHGSHPRQGPGGRVSISKAEAARRWGQWEEGTCRVWGGMGALRPEPCATLARAPFFPSPTAQIGQVGLQGSRSPSVNWTHSAVSSQSWIRRTQP